MWHVSHTPSTDSKSTRPLVADEPTTFNNFCLTWKWEDEALELELWDTAGQCISQSAKRLPPNYVIELTMSQAKKVLSSCGRCRGRTRSATSVTASAWCSSESAAPSRLRHECSRSRRLPTQRRRAGSFPRALVELGLASRDREPSVGDVLPELM